MLDFRTVTGKTPTDALSHPDAAERFWAALPREPLAMQRQLCEALASGAGWDRPDIQRLRALRQIDRRMDRVLDALLSEYAALGGQSPALERQLGQAALELSRAFAQEFERYFRFASMTGASAAWQERLPELAVRMFRHREIDLVLSLCRYERWPRGRWKPLHDAYKCLLSRSAVAQPLPMRQRTDGSIVTVTPEKAYLRILLLHLMDGGRFRPDEIVATRRIIVHWCEAPEFRGMATGPGGDAGSGFVVDLAGTDGPARGAKDVALSDDHLHIDTSSLAVALDAMIAERNDASSSNSTGIPVDRKRDLLRKLRDLYAARPKAFKRRGERIAVALMSVEATLGNMQAIFRMLRDEGRRGAEAGTDSAPYADEITIGDVGAAPAAPEATATAETATAANAAYSAWQIRDRSESGCRLRGRASEAQLLLPGLLMAFRDQKNAPWTLGVVRRLNRVIGNNVELGIEHLGRNPQRVLLLPAAGAEATAGEGRSERILALYLPESDGFPRMPIKSLIVPACEYAHGRIVGMVTAQRDVAIRFKAPLEQQADFVWTSFEPVDAAGERADDDAS